MPDFGRVSLIDASPHKAGTAYVAVKNYLQDDRAPYIFSTDDYGKTWTKIINGIAGRLRACRARRSETSGFALRRNRARHLRFVRRRQQLAVALAQSARYAGVGHRGRRHDLVIATHGRSFYVLDDIDVLRQLTPDVASAPIHLYQPHEAIRSVNQAAFYYYLKQPAEKVTIDILDAKGQKIRTFTSGRADEQKQEARRPEAGSEDSDSGPPPPRLRLTNAGLTKFTWDLRYPGATVFPGMILWSGNAASGPVAAPGNYQVRLTVGDHVETEGFMIRMDPRISGVTEKDLQEQFDFAMKIRDKTSEANQAVIDIREIKKQLKDRVGKMKDRSISTAADALTKKLSEVEEEIYQVRNQSNQDPLNFPIKLNNRLAALRRTVETGDARPTNASYQVFKELSAELEVQLAKFKKIKETDLAEFNKTLEFWKLEPIR